MLRDEIAQGWQRLRIDSLTWRYIGNAILLFLLLFACTFGVGLVIGVASYILRAILGETIGTAIMLIILSVMIVYAIIAGYRLSVKLPAVALGRTDFRMADAWRETMGNNWQMLGLLVLFMLCMVAVSLVMLAITYALGLLGMVGASFAVAVEVIVNWVATILGVTLLTSLYGFFVEGRDF